MRESLGADTEITLAAVHAMETNPIPPDMTLERTDYSLLHTAIIFGYVEAAKNLITAGADLLAVTMDGDTALMISIRLNRQDMALLLIDRMSDINALDKVRTSKYYV